MEIYYSLRVFLEKWPIYERRVVCLLADEQYIQSIGDVGQSVLMVYDHVFYPNSCLSNS